LNANRKERHAAAWKRKTRLACRNSSAVTTQAEHHSNKNQDL
jgi:hypothetical protein